MKHLITITLATILVANSFLLPDTAAVVSNATDVVTISAPKTVHGSDYDHYLIGQSDLTGQYENTTSNRAFSFEVSEQTWGYSESQLARFFGATRRKGVRLESYDYLSHNLKMISNQPERNWDFWSSIASDGSNDGDVVRYFVVTADGVEHDVAEAEIWTGMAKVKAAPGVNIFLINPFHAELNLVVPASMMGRYIVPMQTPAGSNTVRTQPIFIAFDMAAMGSGSRIFDCARAGIEIRRLTGPGHVSVALDANVVKRPGPAATGNGILFGTQNGIYSGGASQCPESFSGQALCFRDNQYWLNRLNDLPNAVLNVVGYPNTIITSDTGSMYLLLGGQHAFIRPTPQQVLNAQWAAHQLSFTLGGGTPVNPGLLGAQLGLYEINWHQFVVLSPDYSVALAGSITLSNGVKIDKYSTIRSLQEQVRSVGSQQDALELAAVLKLLNASCRT